jgi:hypothetical protein
LLPLVKVGGWLTFRRLLTHLFALRASLALIVPSARTVAHSLFCLPCHTCRLHTFKSLAVSVAILVGLSLSCLTSLFCLPCYTCCTLDEDGRALVPLGGKLSADLRNVFLGRTIEMVTGRALLVSLRCGNWLCFVCFLQVCWCVQHFFPLLHERFRWESMVRRVLTSTVTWPG